MTRRLLPFAFALLTPAAAFAQHFHHHIEASPEDNLRESVCLKGYTTPALTPSKQGVEWKVISNSEEAKARFNQGLTLYYGFNYEDALRNFREATRLDPVFVMGWWGMALAAGPNINLLIQDKCLGKAREWSGMAWDLAQKHRRPDSVEYALADALRVRYASSSEVQAAAYAKKMAEVWAKFKPHADVGALYAESLMDEHPWDLYDQNQNPRPWTPEILGVLKAALDSDRDALGANHYWLHAVEAGRDWALAEHAAWVLERKVPRSGHLRHMPSHFYFLSGLYGGAVIANDNATGIDSGQFGTACAGNYEKYIADKDCLQLYYGHYHAHDLFFRSVAESFLGRIKDSLVHAREARAHVERFVPNEPGLQRYMAAPFQVMAAWGMAQPILDEKEPPTDCYITPTFKEPSGCHILRSMWRWARGVAYTSQREPDVQSAKAELTKFFFERGQIRAPTPTGWGNNTAEAVLTIAADTLAARIAWAEGNRGLAIEKLQAGVAHENALVYDEPPQWLFPVRQSLGGAYLACGRWDDAIKVFGEDLARHPENGRSLYGMFSALDQAGRHKEAEVYRKKYEDAWRSSDGDIRKLDDAVLWLLGLPAGSGPCTGAPQSPAR